MSVLDDELKNPFQRAEQKKTLAADQQTKWDKNTEARAKKRELAAAEESKRVDAREKDRQRWNHQSATPKTASGGVLTAELAKLKAAYDADRTKAKTPPRVFDQDALETLFACVYTVMANHPLHFKSDFNTQSLNEAIQTLLKQGYPIAPRTVEEAYQRCLRDNHFELTFVRDAETGGRVQPRGSKILTPPTAFPHCVWPDEALIVQEENAAEAIRLNSEEAQRALSLRFEDLAKEVRAKFKTPKPGAPNLDRS